jgi:hypothetical protein
MAPTIEWHKLNPITVSIREPSAATLPGTILRLAALAEYDEIDASWPEHLRRCHRDVWHLTLWHQLFTEIDMDFMQDYVVLAHDLRQKSELIGRSKSNWVARRPVIVHACATWTLHALSLVWRTDSVEECLYLWAWVIVRFFDGRDERGASILQVLDRAKIAFY